jgi:hypothetical protein
MPRETRGQFFDGTRVSFAALNHNMRFQQSAVLQTRYIQAKANAGIDKESPH